MARGSQDDNVSERLGFRGEGLGCRGERLGCGVEGLEFSI